MSEPMTTVKIRRESLEKLRKLAERENRSVPSQLAVMIEQAFVANPAPAQEVTLADVMEMVAHAAERGELTDREIADCRAARADGAINWGSENGVITGILPDGSRVDMRGRILKR